MKSKLSQKEAVYSITMKVLQENNIAIDGQSVVSLLNGNIRAAITMAFISGIKDGTIGLNKTYTDIQLRRFAQGAIGNWHRKDTRLNGGGQYQAKNPGLKVGMSDEIMKNLSLMAKELEDTCYEGEVLKEMYIRSIQLKKQQKKKIMSKIDINMIPESLRHLL